MCRETNREKQRKRIKGRYRGKNGIIKQRVETKKNRTK
jgi:hypothetical protein